MALNIDVPEGDTYIPLPDIDHAVAMLAQQREPDVPLALDKTLHRIIGNGPSGAAGIERLNAIIDRALLAYGYTRDHGFGSGPGDGEPPWLDCGDLLVAEQRHDAATTKEA